MGSLGPSLAVPGDHISLFSAGFACVRHGDTKLRGSHGLGLDRDGAGLRPPNGALIWGGGWGSPSPLPASRSTPTPSLPSEAHPGARSPP